MTASLVRLDYQGSTVSFNEEGWINATEIAARYGKSPNDWLEQAETAEYIAALLEIQLPARPVIKEIQELINGKIKRATHNQILRLIKKTGLVKTKSGAPETGGGTWLNSDLGVPFARWLDVRFAIWCDRQIRALIAGHHPHFDWKRARSEAASSFKVMADVLKLVRDEQGKVTASHHYINEARLINGVLSGQFAAMDRERLSDSDLSLLAHLEVRNSVLIGRGLPYQDRKLILKQCAIDMRPSAPAVEAAA